MKNKDLSILFFSLIFVMSCTSNKKEQPRIDKEIPIQTQPQPQKVDTKITPASLDLTLSDYGRAVQQAIRNMSRSGSFENPDGGRYTIMVTQVVNMTKQKVDTPEVAEKIRSELVATRKVKVFRGKAGAGKNKILPEISLSGRITERTGYVRGKKRIEYYLQLNLADARSGIALSETVVPVVKRK